MTRVARDSDFGGRLLERLEALQERFEPGDAAAVALRGVHASLDPRDVAAWIIQTAGEWVPAPCWAVVSRDQDGESRVLAERGLVPEIDRLIWGVAGWVLTHGEVFASGDLAADARVPGRAAGSAFAVPLACRGRTAGALVGVDREPSVAFPALAAQTAARLRGLLEPAALALDNALTVRRVEALTVTDDLTRLFNSRYLNLVLRREAKRAARSGQALSLMFIDLDGFKGVNDRHGHLAGSRALVEAATLIRGCARETDVTARYGGDEFSVVLPETGWEGALAVAERIRDRLRTFAFLAPEGLAVRLTASIGIATLPDVAGSAEELLRAADMAMYTVKDAGKNGISVAHVGQGSRQT